MFIWFYIWFELFFTVIWMYLHTLPIFKHISWRKASTKGFAFFFFYDSPASPLLGINAVLGAPGAEISQAYLVIPPQLSWHPCSKCNLHRVILDTDKMKSGAKADPLIFNPNFTKFSGMVYNQLISTFLPKKMQNYQFSKI